MCVFILKDSSSRIFKNALEFQNHIINIGKNRQYVSIY